MKQQVARLGAIGALLGMAIVPSIASAQDTAYIVMPYATNLSAPRGLTIDPDGNLVVAEQGAGNMDGQLTRLIDLDGDLMADNGAEMKAVVNGIPSFIVQPAPGDPPEIIGASDLAYGPDGAVYFVTGIGPDPASEQTAAVWSTNAPNTSLNPLRTANPYAQLDQYEIANNPDGGLIDSNPYSIEVDGDGNAYVNDAGANDTLKVAPDGTVTTYAVYPPVPVPAELGLPFPVTDSVPTGLAIGPDGALYVSLLTGFPFTEGASTVYRLEDTNGDGDAMEGGEMTVFADGLTTSTALAFDIDGDLLATEFRGFLTGQDIASGRVVEWSDGAWNVIADGLVTPTGLTVGPDGTIYVSMEFANTVMQLRPAM